MTRNWKTIYTAFPTESLQNTKMVIERLEKFGPAIQRMPHMRQLDGNLWEIRAISGQGSARIFYCFIHEETFVMLHTFLKKTDKTPQRELSKAKQRMKEVTNE